MQQWVTARAPGLGAVVLVVPAGLALGTWANNRITLQTTATAVVLVLAVLVGMAKRASA